jgi:dGTPase
MFTNVSATENNPKWSDFVKRESSLYSRRDDTRSEFARDYNRILHCTAYRRLKHKTQVFFAPENDHVCTRIEHVNHVTAISYTISKVFNLNTELTNAIAIGHDLGHAPFGHVGQDILNEIARDNIADKFWHEKNSLWFVDNIETLPNPDNKEINLLLTYAVRDGIVCHCGEVDEDSIYPRSDVIKLQEILQPDQVQPFTWEGCVVKVADKIAYIGRDIEDAIRLGILSLKEFLLESKELILYLEDNSPNLRPRQINNTALIHSLVSDLCKSSNPEYGIRFSEKRLALLKGLRQLSGKLIYDHTRLKQYEELAKLALKSIFDVCLYCRNHLIPVSMSISS